MRFLLLGGTGQVGEEFRALTFPDDLEIVAPSHASLDLGNAQAIAAVIAAEPWSAVINAAAFTDVDRAESEEATGVRHQCRGAVATCGRDREPWNSTRSYLDRLCVRRAKGSPLRGAGSAGAAQCLWPQQARRRARRQRQSTARHPAHVVGLQPLWQEFRQNDPAADGRARPPDCRGRPARLPDRGARYRQRLLRRSRYVARSSRSGRPYGVYHFAGAGEATWFEFASSIVELASDRLGRSPQVLPIKTSEYPTPAARAADTRLDSTAILRAFGVKPRPWPQALRDTIDQLLSTKDIS